MSNSSTRYDAIVIGAGPTGSTAALVMARAGLRVLVLDKSSFPRFRIGESFLPLCYAFMRDELGLAEDVAALPHVDKFGAEFAMADCPHEKTVRFAFEGSLTPGGRTFNIERALFDDMLLNKATAAGAQVRTNTGVDAILQLADGDVRLRTDAGEEVAANWLLDASGPQTVVARHLGTRVNATDPELRKVAYFAHFDGVRRLPGEQEGHPLIAMCDEGWFWVIHISPTKTSVGFVTDAALAKSLNVPANRMLDWAISRSPLVRDRMQHATGPATNQIVADFTYACRPFAGAGHFLLGDAAAFVDPIFSTGVCLGMMSAAQAAKHVIALSKGQTQPAAARKRYIDYVQGSTSVFFRLIRAYYRHSFRELFLNGSGPLSMHRAVLSILAGHVFPRPPWMLRWRLWLFHQCVKLQAKFALVPRRKRFSLQASPAGTWGVSHPVAASARADLAMAEVGSVPAVAVGG